VHGRKGPVSQAHAFNSSTREAEAGGFLSSRPAWSTKWVPGQPRLHREILSRRTPPPQKKKKKIGSFRLINLSVMGRDSNWKAEAWSCWRRCVARYRLREFKGPSQEARCQRLSAFRLEYKTLSSLPSTSLPACHASRPDDSGLNLWHCKPAPS
jgi:hypothetical protein